MLEVDNTIGKGSLCSLVPETSNLQAWGRYCFSIASTAATTPTTSRNTTPHLVTSRMKTSNFRLFVAWNLLLLKRSTKWKDYFKQHKFSSDDCRNLFTTKCRKLWSVYCSQLQSVKVLCHENKTGWESKITFLKLQLFYMWYSQNQKLHASKETHVTEQNILKYLQCGQITEYT